MRYVFPKEFVWGAATASFQIEGGRQDRGECIWDRFCCWPGRVSDGDTGDIADDHYHRVDEDVALMSHLGLDAYRFSISWPRVLPTGSGEVNQAGLDFYDRLVDTLLAAHIDPYVTLYHWDLPEELQRLGGWAARDTAMRFADYCAIVAQRLGDRVQHWITHNEPWVVAFVGNLMGRHAPGWQDLGLALQVAHHLLVSHGLAVPIIRASSGPDASVGITLNMAPAHAASAGEQDKAAARRQDGFLNRWFADPVFKGCYPQDMWDLYGYLVPRVAPDDMPLIAQPIDFLGINYYSRSVIRHTDGAFLDMSSTHPEGEYTAMDWEVYPAALTELLLRVTTDYAPKALYITENGCAYDDFLAPNGRVHDGRRLAYLRQHLVAANKAIAQGAPLGGYFAWSLMDNFEWALGYSKRFGIHYVDYDTQKRYLKDSGLYYRHVIAENAVSD